MKQFTVRGIPEELEKRILKEAEKQGISMNKALISILESAGGRGGGGKKVVHKDLDHLSGSWSEEEAQEFDTALTLQRTIDEEMWKKTG